MREETLAASALPALAARAQLGDRRALESLLRHLQSPLGDHVRGIIQDHDAAADVLQDVLLIICRKLGTLRDTAWVRAWSYRIATREAYRAIGHARRFDERPVEEMADVLESPAEASDAEHEALLAALPAKLAALPAGAQIVLRMHYLQSLTQQEVAAALEIPLGTVKSRLSYGLTCLRQSYVRSATTA